MGWLDWSTDKPRDDRGARFQPRSELLHRAEYRAPRRHLLTTLLAVCILLTSPFWYPHAWYMTKAAGLNPRWMSSLVTAVILGCLLWSLVGSFRARRLGFQRAMADRKAQSRCPGCDYELKDLPTDNDGMTTCPECGCAWKL